MKAVILAGGLGTRLSEETHSIPKPMVEIGQRPILWHIMKCYSFHGINEFIICCGYKGNVIKEYFASYGTYNSDITVDLQNNSIEVHEKSSESWRITLIDTGQETMTGGRLKRVSKFIEQDELFCFTYGDGLSDINITELVEAHKNKGLLVTLTAVYPPGRFGALKINEGIVTSFQEKPKGDNSRINGGFFVLSPKVLDYITDDSTVWEQDPLEKLAQENQIQAYLHDGFWQAMDTLRDKIVLEELWDSNKAEWKKWK